MYSSIPEAMKRMNHAREVVRPVYLTSGEVSSELSSRIREFHARKYAVFHKMYDHFQEIRGEMKQFL